MRGHFIKPNHRTESLQHAIFFDTETDPEVIDPQTTGHVLRQGWAAYTRLRRNGTWSDPEWFRFETVDQFWRWVTLKARRKTRLYLFCHNSSFDYPVVDAFRWLPAHGWLPDRLVIEAPPTIIRVRNHDKTLVLLDTLNWWRMPLSALGASIGLPKLEFPSAAATRDEWDTYNRRDVEIILRAVQLWCNLVRDRDLGGFQPTLAGQAFAAWRHRFMPAPVLIDANADALAVSRAAYHGGRVEAFHIGHLTQRLHLLDINSMYPHVMREHAYPTVLRYHSRHMTPDKLWALMRRRLVCAHVRVRVDQPAIGVMHNDRYIFPTGEFDAYLSTPELQWIRRHGELLHCYEVAAYAHAHLFRDWVDTLYQWRQDAIAAGDTVLAGQIKILMNSLYGKFGQRGIRYELIGDTPDLSIDSWREVHIDTKEVHQYRQLMGKIQELQRDSESASSHPAIAAHVTAHARMLLFSLIEEAGREHVYYGDTDSLLVDDEGLMRLSHRMDATRLGALKLEGSFDRCEIHGCKDYVFGSKVRTKGVRASALWLDPNTVEQEKWSGLKGLLRSGKLDRPTTALVTKHLARTYDKGTVGTDGSVSPIVLG